jgi:hypothetical protein
MFDLKNLFKKEEEEEKGCFPELSFTERLIGFGVCTVLGYFIQLLSFGAVVSALTGNPTKFALTYTIGNILSLLS